MPLVSCLDYDQYNHICVFDNPLLFSANLQDPLCPIFLTCIYTAPLVCGFQLLTVFPCFYALASNLCTWCFYLVFQGCSLLSPQRILALTDSYTSPAPSISGQSALVRGPLNIILFSKLLEKWLTIQKQGRGILGHIPYTIIVILSSVYSTTPPQASPIY